MIEARGRSCLRRGLQVPWLAGAVLALLMLLPSQQVHAQEPTFRLAYRTPGNCPSAADFRSRLEARLRGAVSRAQLARTQLQVQVITRDAATVGSVQFGDNPLSTREVTGESCDAVVHALALVVAVTLERESQAALDSTILGIRRSDPPPLPRNRPTSPQWAVGTTVDWGAAHAPRWVAEGGVFLEHVSDQGTHSGPFVWAVRMALLRSVLATYSTSVGSADFQRTIGRLEGCAIGLPIPPAFALRGCWVADVGLLRAEGRTGGLIQHPRRVDAFWLSTGPGLRLQAMPNEWSLVELQSTFTTVLSGRNFVFERPNAPVFQTPVVALFLGVGLGVRFR